jgi:hypothetical protein
LGALVLKIDLLFWICNESRQDAFSIELTGGKDITIRHTTRHKRKPVVGNDGDQIGIFGKI